MSEPAARAAAIPVGKPPDTAPDGEVAALPAEERPEEHAHVDEQASELRCTLCGLRACWTA